MPACQRSRIRAKKLLRLRVVDPRGLTRNRELLRPGTEFTVNAHQSHSHVDRWLAQGRIRLI